MLTLFVFPCYTRCIILYAYRFCMETSSPSTRNQWVGYLAGGLVVLAVVVGMQMQVSQAKREMREMRVALERSLMQEVVTPKEQAPPQNTAPVRPTSSTDEYTFFCDRGDDVLPPEKRDQLNTALEEAGFDRLQESFGMYCRRIGDNLPGIVVTARQVCASPSTQDCAVEEHVLRETAPGVLSPLYSLEGSEIAYGTLIGEVRAWSPEGVTVRVQELLLEGGCTEEAVRGGAAFVDRFIRFSDQTVTTVKTCSIKSCSDVSLVSCR